VSYIFYCSNQTMDECFQKALFNTGTLYGPFTATRKSQLNLDPYAFLSSGRNYPAQVEVKWGRVMKLERPYSKLRFLDGLQCRLTPSQTVKLMTRLIEEDNQYIHRWM